MKERPIIFSGPMVRAILDGRKTQTRRVVKRPKSVCFRVYNYYPGNQWWVGKHPNGGYWAVDIPQGPEPWMVEDTKNLNRKGFSCPYGVPGDRLWVRETFYKHKQIGMKFSDEYENLPDNDKPYYRKCPSIFMPKYIARIMLEIKSVRAERLQDIGIEDVHAEGIERWRDYEGGQHLSAVTTKNDFHRLWDSLNGKKHPWASNPWVFIIEFERIEP